jgi:hypothetical protein
MFFSHSVTQPSTEVDLFLNKSLDTWAYYSVNKNLKCCVRFTICKVFSGKFYRQIERNSACFHDLQTCNEYQNMYHKKRIPV